MGASLVHTEKIAETVVHDGSGRWSSRLRDSGQVASPVGRHTRPPEIK